MNSGAAVLSLGRFGCRGWGSPRTRAKQGSHQSPVGGEADAVKQLIFAPHDLPIEV